MIYFIRKLTANFLLDDLIKVKSLNGLTIENSVLINNATYEEYISDVVMHFEKGVQSLLLFVIPVIMKMNIHIVNIDTSAEAKMYKEMSKFSVIEGPAKHQDLMHIIEGDSALNLHDQTLYALRKDGHYDALFSIGAEIYTESGSSDAAKRVNANFIKPHMTSSGFDQDFNDVLDPKDESQSFE